MIRKRCQDSVSTHDTRSRFVRSQLAWIDTRQPDTLNWTALRSRDTPNSVTVKVIWPTCGQGRKISMTLVCYLDDSGTDAANSMVTIGGYIGTQESWRAFELDARRVMNEYGVTYIRGRDIHSNNGEYAGWTTDKKTEFITRLNQVLAPLVGLAISCATLKSVFNVRAIGHVRTQSPFGFCFEMLIHRLVNDEGFSKVVRRPNVALSFVIEEGNSNNNEIFQRYERLKAAHGTELPYFAGMTFAAKNSSIAIQMADLFAFLTRRQAVAMEKNSRNPIEPHRYLTALRTNIRDIGQASTDFGYSD